MERHTALIKGVFDIRVGVKKEIKHITSFSHSPLHTEIEKDIIKTVLSKEVIEVKIDNPQLKKGDILYLSNEKITVIVKSVCKTDIENTIMYIVDNLYKNQTNDDYDNFLKLKKEYENKIIKAKEYFKLKHIELKKRTLWQRVWNKKIEFDNEGEMK